MEEFIIHMFLSLVSHAVKNPAKAALLKTAMLDVRNEISGLYPGE